MRVRQVISLFVYKKLKQLYAKLRTSGESHFVCRNIYHLANSVTNPQYTEFNCSNLLTEDPAYDLEVETSWEGVTLIIDYGLPYDNDNIVRNSLYTTYVLKLKTEQGIYYYDWYTNCLVSDLSELPIRKIPNRDWGLFPSESSIKTEQEDNLGYKV